MTSLSKKLTVAFLAGIAAVCIAFGLLFTAPKTASAAEGDTTVTLSEIGDFTKTDLSGGKYVLTGLSEAGRTKIGTSNFTITVPANVAQIGNGNKQVLDPQYIDLSKFTGITFNSDVTKIASNAFKGCSGLTQIDLSTATKLETIDASAFNSSSVSNTVSITIPASVKTIGDLAFANHNKVTAINFYAVECNDFTSSEETNPFYKAGYNSDGVSVTIGGTSAVKRIPANMFKNVTSNPNKVTAVNFSNVDLTPESTGENTVKFGASAFMNCKALTSLSFSAASKITEIGEKAFYQCTNLENLIVPGDTTIIGDEAFRGCTKLKTISYNNKSGATLPSLTTYGGYSFAGCTSLGNVTIPKSVTNINNNAFNGCAAFTEINIPENVTTIALSAFSNCANVETINFNALSANGVGSSPFTDTGRAVTLNIGNNLTGTDKISKMYSQMFKNTNIETVNASNIVINNDTAFMNEVFAECAKLKSVDFDSTCVILEMGDGTFSNCSSLQSVNLPSNLRKIRTNMFNGCSSLYGKNIIPSAVTSIGEKAFLDCASLYEISIPEDVTYIGSQAFLGCIKLLEVEYHDEAALTFNAGQNYAFGQKDEAGNPIQRNDYTAAYAKNVYTTTTVNGSHIDADENGYVFYSGGNEMLLIGYTGTKTKLNLSEDITRPSYEIYVGAFKNNRSLTEIVIPSNVKAIKEQAFYGCTSLETVTLPANLDEFGASVFYGCTSLRSINLPSVSTITNSMFYNCISLESINIPASVTKIDRNAFYNCKKLSNITFNKHETDGNKLKTIELNAFENCSSLKTVIIPNSVNAIGSYAFRGCTNLSTVYLPDTLSNPAAPEMFEERGSNLILIAPTQEAYNSSYSEHMSKYGKVTYIVNVSLINVVGGTPDASVDTVEKLMGFNSNYVKQSDGSWLLESNGMPVQSGYEESVWYNEVTLENKVLASDLTNKLKEENINNSDGITLYAKYIPVPELEYDSDRVEYDSKDNAGKVNYTIDNIYAYNEIFSNYSYEDSEFILNVTSYKLATGVSADIPTENGNQKIGNAGTYIITVSIKDADDYGVWADSNDRNYKFIITPYMLSIAQYVNWITVDSDGNEISRLNSSSDEGFGPLYLYGTEDEIVPFLQEVDRDNFLRQVSVTNSFLTYSASAEYTVALASNKYFTVISYYDGSANTVTDGDGKEIGVKATGAGQYSTEVTIQASNNYRLHLPTDTEQGLGIKFTEKTSVTGGYEYEMVKTWYIAMSDSNSLVIGGSAFSLPVLDATTGAKGWVFGDIEVDSKLVRPTLSATGDEENLIGEFTLLSSLLDYNDVKMTTYKWSQYEDVINYTMPAGSYTLIISVKASGDYSAEPYSFKFEVVKADYIDKLEGWGIKGEIYGNLYKAIGASHTAEYDNGRVVYASTKDAKVDILDLDRDVIYEGVRKGVWKEPECDKYYTKFEISYNLDGFSKYYSADDVTYGPRDPGEYTVYFNIASSNYKPLVDTTKEIERKQYKYTLQIRRAIDILTDIDLGDLTYTGSELKFEDTDYYKFVYFNGKDNDSFIARNLFAKSENEEYVSAGKHCVALMIKSAYEDKYAWKVGGNTSSELIKGTNGKFVLLEFNIEAAKNFTTRALDIRGWTYNSFDPIINAPKWDTQFVSITDEITQQNSPFTFKLVMLNENGEEDESTVYYYGLGATENGRKTFAQANAGKYHFYAIAPAPAGAGWAELTEAYGYDITISKAELTLAKDPYIENWKYGDYGKSYGSSDKKYGDVPECSFTEGFADVKTKYYIVTSAEYEKYLDGEIGKEQMTMYTMGIEYMLKDGQVPAGKYVLVYEVDESEGASLGSNYEEWSYAVHFDVGKADNFWKKTPIVGDWVYGDYSTRGNTVDYEPVYGTKGAVNCFYRKLGVDGTPVDSKIVTSISDLGLDQYGELPVGKYKFWAELPDTESNNYAGLYIEMDFNVTPATNSWKSDGIPGIISWSHGNWNAETNAIKGEATYGEVEFSIYAADDVNREKAYNIDDLNSLDVGSYILVAYVEGGKNYSELGSVTTFAVFEDSVGMSGIIAATMVFAIVAIGLAVAGVLLLVRRNKKTEQEFRRMIRSELRRK